MEEKGGATKKDGKYIESHHMLLIFMIVLNFVVLVLCLVFLGMQLYRREENIANMELENQSGEYIIEIKPLRFDTLGKASYESASANQNGGSSIIDGTVVDGAEYKIVNTGSELANVLSAIRNSATVAQGLDYVNVDESFFETGSVLVVAIEEKGLENFQIGKLTRDENGAVTVVANYTANSEIENTYGSVVILKVENVQPKSLTLDFTKN